MRFESGLSGSVLGALAATLVVSLLLGPVSHVTWIAAVILGMFSANVIYFFEDERWTDDDFVMSGLFNTFVGMLVMLAVGHVFNVVDMSFKEMFDAGVFALFIGILAGGGQYIITGRVQSARA